MALAEEVEADMAAEEVEATGVGVEVTGAAGASGVVAGASVAGEEEEEAGSGSRTTDPRSMWSVSHRGLPAERRQQEMS